MITEIIILAIFAQFLGADYGMAGVFSIVFFYAFFKDIKATVLSQAFVFIAIWLAITYAESGGVNVNSVIQSASLFSLILIRLYKNEEGLKAKYLFYLFYPIHLLIIYAIKVL